MATRQETSKRQALLDGALVCFLEHGVVETTVEHVLHRSGASVGSLYHHFGGKEQLADALYTDCLGVYHHGACERLDLAVDAESGVRGIVEHHLGWIVAHTDRAKFLLAYRDHEIRPASDELLSLNRVFYGRLEHWIVDRATVPLPPLPAVISQWLGPTHSFSRHWLTRSVRTEPDDAQPFLSNAAWHALQPLFTPTTTT